MAGLYQQNQETPALELALIYGVQAVGKVANTAALLILGRR